jgi:hypothetical protein
MRLHPPPRPAAYEPDSIPAPPRDSLLMRVNRRRSQILTFMVSVAAIASFGSVVWWAHSQDVKAGGKGLEPLVVQAPTTPSRIKPENAGGLVPPNQDKEVFNRIAPGAVPTQPEKLLPASTNPKLPANGLPTPAAPKPAEPEASKTPTPLQPAAPATGSGPTPPPTTATATDKPATVQSTDVKPATTEAGPSIASLIDNISGPTGGWRVQVASVKNEDVAKSTWARLQSAHGDVMANLRMQAVRVDLGDKGVWYRVQAGPLDEKQAHSVCNTLKGRKTDCVVVAPAR